MKIFTLNNNEPTSLENLKVQHFHIWKFPLIADEQEFSALMQLLDDAEKKRANAFAVAHARQQYIIAHGGLRKILAIYLNKSPGEIQFSLSHYGKPYLINHPYLQFNLSHSHAMGVVAVAFDKAIGVDIEYQGRNDIDILGVAKNTFTAQEFAQIEAAEAAKQKKYFYTVWAQKEAVIKAIGQGFHYPLDKFTVSAAGESPLIVLPDRPDELTLYAVEVDADYICYAALNNLRNT